MSEAATPAPQFVLVVETTPPGEALLAAILAEAPPTCLIVAAEDGLPLLATDDAETPPDRPLHLEHARKLVAAAQDAGVAALVAGDPAGAIETGADGIHLDFSEEIADRFEAMRRILGSNATIGVVSNLSRHTAMVLGEAGADYIGFDLRPGARLGGCDMVAWWAEIFEIPVVAFVADLEAARAARGAGADFIALCPPPGTSLADALRVWREVRALATDSAG
jgi:thiamine-phosphate pyrophosphorylase